MPKSAKDKDRGSPEVKVTFPEKAVLGSTTKKFLRNAEEWGEIHRAARRGKPLVKLHPQSAAALRLLLLQDPMVRLVVEGLESFPTKSEVLFRDLAKTCDTLDHARAPIFFLKPESTASLTDDNGQIRWDEAQSEDYRSTMYFQLKSILKHAGIIEDTGLGGSSSKNYQPEKDLWVLR